VEADPFADGQKAIVTIAPPPFDTIGGTYRKIGGRVFRSGWPIIWRSPRDAEVFRVPGAGPAVVEDTSGQQEPSLGSECISVDH
jgi:hypothetical protein